MFWTKCLLAATCLLAPRNRTISLRLAELLAVLIIVQEVVESAMFTMLDAMASMVGAVIECDYNAVFTTIAPWADITHTVLIALSAGLLFCRFAMPDRAIASYKPKVLAAAWLVQQVILFVIGVSAGIVWAMLEPGSGK
jgi:hypothetical protein